MPVLYEPVLRPSWRARVAIAIHGALFRFIERQIESQKPSIT